MAKDKELTLMNGEVSDMAGNIAIAATSIAITSGIIAIGAAVLADQKTREKLVNETRNVIDNLRSVMVYLKKEGQNVEKSIKEVTT
jgi:hypothetical protein